MKTEDILDHDHTPTPPLGTRIIKSIGNGIVEVIAVLFAVVTFIPLRILMAFNIDPFGLKDNNAP